jgi:hypothetical protein
MAAVLGFQKHDIPELVAGNCLHPLENLLPMHQSIFDGGYFRNRTGLEMAFSSDSGSGASLAK